MKIKEYCYQKKKLVAGLLLAFIVGVISGIGNMPNDEMIDIINDDKKVISKIESVNEDISKVESEIELLVSRKNEADRIAKEEADRIAKEEADRIAKEEADRIAKEEADRVKAEANKNNSVSNGNSNNQKPQGKIVWLSATGSKYHTKNNCGNMNPNKATQIDINKAIEQGYNDCSKC